jgi:hypothetical protein
MNLEDFENINLEELIRENIITPEERKLSQEKLDQELIAQLYRYYEDDKDYEAGDVDIDNDFS